jgi:hypothetical protein
MFLKDVELWLKRGQYVRFLREKCPLKKNDPKIGANIGAITGILLNKLISSMEVRFNTFPLSSWCDNILIELLIF